MERLKDNMELYEYSEIVWTSVTGIRTKANRLVVATPPWTLSSQFPQIPNLPPELHPEVHHDR